MLIAVPEIITVSSDEGLARTKQNEFMGIYKLESEPDWSQAVWGNSFGNKLFFSDKNAKWAVASDANMKADTGVTLQTTETQGSIFSNWEYLDGSNWQSDSGLTLTWGEPSWPETITISSRCL